MTIAENISRIRKQVSNAAQPFGLDPERAELIAVSKKQPQEKLISALEAGHRHFGENRVQEAYEHWEDLKISYPDLFLHLIGPLQTNKAAQAVTLFDMIHTLDREKLARILSSEMKKQDRNIPCLIQVNTGVEAQKSGIVPDKLPDFLGYCRADCDLDVRGLMCIPPADEPAGLHFGLLRKLADDQGLTELSMGMSSDFEKAVPLGASYIRVGTAIFGAREAIS